MAMGISTTLEVASSPSNSAKSLADSAKPKSIDAILASEFRDLESSICDLELAGEVFEVVMDRYLGKTDCQGDDIKFEMSRREWNALFFGMYQMTNRARDLKAQFFAGFDKL